MIAILTDKPNVGKEIARILGAHTREDGYMSGNGYMVTWTFGNMLSLAMPKDYGMDRPERGDFPINPAPFRLMVKHIRTDTGWIPDINAVLQLKVIEKYSTPAKVSLRPPTPPGREKWSSGTFTGIWNAGNPTAVYGSRHLRTKPCWKEWAASGPAACMIACFWQRTAATRRTGYWDSTPAMPSARRPERETTHWDGCRHPYWQP